MRNISTKAVFFLYLPKTVYKTFISLCIIVNLNSLFLYSLILLDLNYFPRPDL